jgi:PilZ domain
MRRARESANILHESSMTERRSQPRLLDADLVMVGWEENSTKLNQLGSVHDVSPGGLGVLVSHALPVGTSVTISYGEGELNGIVRHNSQLIDGHFMGIEFAENSKNSTLHFQPELLVRLA